MKESFAIPTDVPKKESMDYDFLRKKGIELAQKFSGQIWTDYNDHDPGVTLLEQLCFTMTDLSYRTDFEIKRILEAGKNVHEDAMRDTFFPPQEILPSHPITPNDYRRLLIDRLPEVKNAWVNTDDEQNQGIKGIYKVYLQVEEDLHEDQKKQAKKKARELLNRHRNLGEDIGEIQIFETEEISISATIFLANDILGETVMGKLIAMLEDFFSPSLRFYSFEELIAEGYPPEKILEGPRMDNGYIKEEDLRPLPTEIRISKLSEMISSMEGVVGLDLDRFIVKKQGIPIAGDVIRLGNNKLPRLADYLGANSNSFDQIRFKKGNIPYTVDFNTASQIYSANATRFQTSYMRKSRLGSAFELKSPPIKNLDQYYSFQKILPVVYGLGEYGVARQGDPLLQGRAKQLKAYLLVFDQLLANYLSQLEEVKSLFAIEENIDQTYFAQAPLDVPRIEGVLRNTHKQSYKEHIRFAYDELKKTSTRFGLQVDWKVEFSNFENRARLSGFDDALNRMVEGLKRAVHNLRPAPLPKDASPLDIEENDQSHRTRQRRLLLTIDEFRLACVREAFKSNLQALVRKMDPFFERRNRFLDHLLARFAEVGEAFSTVHLSNSGNLEASTQEKELLHAKIRLLQEYADLSKNRSSAADFHLQLKAIPKNSEKEVASGKVFTTVAQAREFLEANGKNPEDYEIRQVSKESSYLSRLQKKISIQLNMPLEKAEKSPFREFSAFAKDTTVRLDKLGQDQYEPRLRETGSQTDDIPKLFAEAEIEDPEPEKEKFVFFSARPGLLAELLTYGQDEENYAIFPFPGESDEDTLHYLITFQGPSFEVPIKIYQASSNSEAKNALSKLMKKLKGLQNEVEEKGEDFYLLEHLLLRPVSPEKFLFEILDSNANQLLRSYEPGGRELQMTQARNILIPATRKQHYVLESYRNGWEVLLKEAGQVSFVAEKDFMSKQEAEEFLASSLREAVKKEENYSPEQIAEGFFELRLHDEQGQLLARSEEVFTSSKQIDPYLARIMLLTKKKKEDYFQVVEADLYELEVVDENGQTLLLEEKAFFSLDEAEAFLDQSFPEAKADGLKFSIKKGTGNAFKVLFLELGEAIARLVPANSKWENLFESEESARQRIDEAVEELQIMRGKNILNSRMSIFPEGRTEDQKQLDHHFFSSQLSLVFPDWPGRCQNEDFRKYMQQAVAEEAPAHLRLNFFWLDFSEMKAFEELYEEWWELKVRTVWNQDDLSLSQDRNMSRLDRLSSRLGQMLQSFSQDN